MEATPPKNWESNWARAEMIILKARFTPRLRLAAKKEMKAEMTNANKNGSQIHWSERIILRRIRINMVWECGLSECGVGYGTVAGTCEQGNEISCSISGVEFPDQRRITFQDCVHRREYSSVYFVYAFCERKAQAASDESLRRFPSPHHRNTVLPGRMSICHTAIFVTVWSTTGRYQPRTDNDEGSTTAHGREDLLNRPKMKKKKNSNTGMANVTSGSSVPNHCLRVQALQSGDTAARNISLSLDRGTTSTMKTNFILWSELTWDDIIKWHNIQGWFLSTAPYFRASTVQRRSLMNAWRGRQRADSFLTNVRKYQTANCSS